MNFPKIPGFCQELGHLYIHLNAGTAEIEHLDRKANLFLFLFSSIEYMFVKPNLIRLKPTQSSCLTKQR